MDSALSKIYQEGDGGLPVFAGSYRQGGGGFLANLFRVALPFLKNVGKHAVNVASSTAHDVLDDRDTLGSALMKNSAKEIGKVFATRKRPLLKDAVVHKQTKRRRMK